MNNSPTIKEKIIKVLLKGEVTTGEIVKALGYSKYAYGNVIPDLDGLKEEGIINSRPKTTGRPGKRPTVWYIEKELSSLKKIWDQYPAIRLELQRSQYFIELLPSLVKYACEKAIPPTYILALGDLWDLCFMLDEEPPPLGGIPPPDNNNRLPPLPPNHTAGYMLIESERRYLIENLQHSQRLIHFILENGFEQIILKQSMPVCKFNLEGMDKEDMKRLKAAVKYLDNQFIEYKDLSFKEKLEKYFWDDLLRKADWMKVFMWIEDFEEMERRLFIPLGKLKPRP